MAADTSVSIDMVSGLHLNHIRQSTAMTQKGKLIGLVIGVVIIDLTGILLSLTL